MQIDPKDHSSAELYRLMISTVVPRPIAWVSTHSEAGVVNVAPFSYFQAIGSRPPLLMLSIGQRRYQGQRIDKDTLRNIRSQGEFVVNIVTEAHLDAVNHSAIDCPPEHSEVEELGLATAPSEVISVPRIASCPVHYECVTHQILQLGDHGRMSVVIGEVVRFHVDPDLWDAESGTVDVRKLRPLARLGGKLYAGLGEIFERDRPSWPTDE